MIAGDDEKWEHIDNYDWFYQFVMDENGKIYRTYYDLDRIDEELKKDGLSGLDGDFGRIDYEYPDWISESDTEWMDSFLWHAECCGFLEEAEREVFKMLKYLDGQRLWNLIEDDIYKQIEDIVLELNIDDLIKIFTENGTADNVPEIKKISGGYLLGEEILTETEIRRHIRDLVSYNWALVLSDDLFEDHINRYNIHEIGGVIKEIEAIQDVLEV